MNFQHDILLKVKSGTHSKRKIWATPCEQSYCHQLTKWGGLADMRRPDGLKLVNLDITVTPPNEQLNQFWHRAVIMPCHWKVYSEIKPIITRWNKAWNFMTHFFLPGFRIFTIWGPKRVKIKEVCWIINDRVVLLGSRILKSGQQWNVINRVSHINWTHKLKLHFFI